MELKRALWKAPELLRDPSPLLRGSQKGDVYSFGIVLYEIIGRKGPWGETTYNHDGEFITSLLSCPFVKYYVEKFLVHSRGVHITLQSITKF